MVFGLDKTVTNLFHNIYHRSSVQVQEHSCRFVGSLGYFYRRKLAEGYNGRRPSNP